MNVVKSKIILTCCELKTGWLCKERAEKTQRISAPARGEGHAVPFEMRFLLVPVIHVMCQIKQSQNSNRFASKDAFNVKVENGDVVCHGPVNM
jgi:hypothetical protein